MGQLLIDTQPLTFTLTEDASKPGKFIARGEFARTDKATANKRLYKENLWRREIGKLSEGMSDRRVFGELDHPSDGRTKLQRVSHLMTNLTIDGNQVVGEAEIMDTPNGRILKAILEAGGKVGVSSRGFGSTKTLPDGTEEVQEDFQLHTFDFVADPATRTAYPNIFHEEREHIEEAEVELTLERLKADYAGLVDEIKRELSENDNSDDRDVKDRFSAELRQQLERIDAVAYERAKSELLSDPSVASAKQILETIAPIVVSYAGGATQQAISDKDAKIEQLEGELAAKDLEIKEAKQAAKKAAALAKEAAYKLHVERAAAGHVARDTIIKLIGDVSQYKSVDEIDQKVEAVVDELSKHMPEHDETEEPSEHVRDLEAQLADANERIERANERTKRAIKVAENIAESAHLEGYKRAKLESVSDKKQRSLIENAQSVEDIEDSEYTREPEQLSVFRDKVQAKMARGKSSVVSEDEGDGKVSHKGSILESFGLDADRFNQLVGNGN